MSGPWTNVTDTMNWYRRSSSYRQKPPWTAVQPYSLDDVFVHARTGGENSVAKTFPYGLDNGNLSLAAQSAYKNFVNATGDNASIGASLAEWHQAQNMIVNRATQMYRALKLVKQGRLGLAARTLEVRNYEDKLRRRNSPVSDSQKRWSERWLEFHFGWAPLIRDIHSAVNVLQSEPQPVRIHGSGQSQQPKYDSKPWSAYMVGHRLFIDARVQYFADIAVSNPNLYMANKLGLVNPLAVAWEVVPFSFVVDWFVPVGNFLNQWSDFLGLSLKNSGSTSLLVNRGYRFSHQSTPFKRSDYTSVYMRRSAGITGPSLKINAFTGFSVTRGATAIALLMKGLTAR